MPKALELSFRSSRAFERVQEMKSFSCECCSMEADFHSTVECRCYCHSCKNFDQIQQQNHEQELHFIQIQRQQQEQIEQQRQMESQKQMQYQKQMELEQQQMLYLQGNFHLLLEFVFSH